MNIDIILLENTNLTVMRKLLFGKTSFNVTTKTFIPNATISFVLSTM